MNNSSKHNVDESHRHDDEQKMAMHKVAHIVTQLIGASTTGKTNQWRWKSESWLPLAEGCAGRNSIDLGKQP